MYRTREIPRAVYISPAWIARAKTNVQPNTVHTMLARRVVGTRLRGNVEFPNLFSPYGYFFSMHARLSAFFITKSVSGAFRVRVRELL